VSAPAEDFAGPAPDVSVAIVHKGMEGDVERLLATLFPLPGRPSAEVILVSNSAGEFRAALMQRYPALVIVPTDEPFGMARYRNKAIERARGRYIVHLDADLTVLEDMLDETVRFMDAHPEAGCAGGQQVSPDGVIQPSGRRFYTFGSMLFRRTPLQRWFPQSRVVRDYLMLDWDRTSERAVDWVSGAFFVMRRAMLDEIGAFDERFTYGMEDIDWCMRVRLSGSKTLYMPRARVVHVPHQSSNRFLSWSWREHLKSTVRYHEKHGWRGAMRRSARPTD
jgi:N-acetylglucosaminyl-diphospho-decaprenol L-rhamnosyltransferase